MSKILSSIIILACIFIFQAKLTRLLDSPNQTTTKCVAYSIRSRAKPTLYLTPVNGFHNTTGGTNGVTIKATVNYYPWCFSEDNFVFNYPDARYFLEISEADPINGEVIFTYYKPSETQKQKWLRTQYYDNENAYKIQSQAIGSGTPCLEVLENSQEDDNKEREEHKLVLKACDMKNIRQDWFIEALNFF